MQLFSGEYFLVKLGAVLAIAGIACGASAIGDVIDDNRTPLDYNTMTAADVKEGEIVEGDLPLNYGIYEEIYHTDRFGNRIGGSDYAFVIPVGEEEYMGIYTGNEDFITDLDAQTDAFYALMSDKNAPAPGKVHFKGKIEKMDRQEEGFFVQCLEEMGFTASEISRYGLKYHIRIVMFSRIPAMLLLGIGFLLAGACVLAVYVFRKSRGY